MATNPGEVWLADLGLAAKYRPVVIVSRAHSDPPRALVLYVPLTTQDRQSQYEVRLPQVRFLDQGSVAKVQGPGSLPTVRLGANWASCPKQQWRTSNGHCVCARPGSRRLDPNQANPAWFRGRFLLAA